LQVFDLSRFGQSLITALERDHPDRALALRRGRGNFQVVSWLLRSLLIRDGRGAGRGTWSAELIAPKTRSTHFSDERRLKISSLEG
jgi:hypothetical protein